MNELFNKLKKKKKTKNEIQFDAVMRIVTNEEEELVAFEIRHMRLHVKLESPESAWVTHGEIRHEIAYRKARIGQMRENLARNRRYAEDVLKRIEAEREAKEAAEPRKLKKKVKTVAEEQMEWSSAWSVRVD